LKRFNNKKDISKKQEKKKKNAEKDYNQNQIIEAETYYNTLNNLEIEKLGNTLLLGLTGSLESYTLDEFQTSVEEYGNIGIENTRNNLHAFIKDIIPTAETYSVRMAIHYSED